MTNGLILFLNISSVASKKIICIVQYTLYGANVPFFKNCLEGKLSLLEISQIVQNRPILLGIDRQLKHYGTLRFFFNRIAFNFK